VCSLIGVREMPAQQTGVADANQRNTTCAISSSWLPFESGREVRPLFDCVGDDAMDATHNRQPFAYG
jgi:hypothetical protein